MDRNKINTTNRAQKKMSSLLSSELFALGSKNNREESKNNKMVPIKCSSTIDRKRESATITSSISKKPKLNSRIANEITCIGHSHELWEQIATDCETIELVDIVYSAIDQQDNDTVLRILCGSIKQLILSSRIKLDAVIYLTLSYICKLHPNFFCNDISTSALLSILRRDSIVKNRQCSQAHVLASNLLTKSYNNKQHWPESFLRTYIEDASNERIWTDNELCAPFIKNICAVFRTLSPSKGILFSDGVTIGISHQNRDIIGFDDDSSDNFVNGAELDVTVRSRDVSTCSNDLFEAQNRYSEIEDSVQKIVTDAIKDQLNKRQQQDCYTRNLLKFLCSTSGLLEVRYQCITRLELWIHNGKLVKFAQQLLSYICFNIRSTFIKDHEVLAMLVKMRLKTKPLINFYMACIKEMILLQPDTLPIILKLVVQNELSNTRNPNNMGMLATMFQTLPEQSAVYLAEIYKEFLLQREDCLRTLRVFLRELMRLLRFEFNITKFCKIFLNEKQDISKQIGQSEFKDRIFYSMVDITCVCMLLAVSPHVRESIINLRTNRDMKCNPVLMKFYNQISQVQLDAVSWMYETVPNLFNLQSMDYNQALQKVLLLENPDQYSRCDQWPSEPERAILLRMISETPIHEETLLRIILIGITKDIPFTIPDTIDLIMLVIKRASAMRNTNCPAIQANKFDIIDFLFSMAEYHHPENIKLPIDYNPPKLAIIVLYWKAWLIMLMISAHNPSTFGAFCWNHYPTMKMLIEMCITNQFDEKVVSKEELQILAMEREHILEFESYLAAQTSQAIITEENAILISQLMLMDPMGTARKIPTIVLDQLRYINKSLKLGSLLCRSRKPDLLLDIIQRQGTTQSMPWLSDLVQNNEGDFNHLPVQCLCEFLLFNANVIKEDNSRDAELVNFLTNLVVEPNSSKQAVCEVLDYIFRRLSSTLKQSRTGALRGIKIIFKCSDIDENDWLLRSIPEIVHFKEVNNFIIPQLRAACQVENSPELVMAYIQFIAAHTLNDTVTDMLDHVSDMAQLIVERNTMFQHIIPASETSPHTVEFNDVLYESRFQTLKCLFVMFNNYIIKLREHHEPYELSEYPDLLMVQFEDGIQLPLQINIIHAFIILLTHSSNTMPESIPILDYWFPPGRTAPNAYLPNMSQEPVQLLPDWLKLKMIRSSVDRLIEAALQELLPDQIVLFVQNFGTPVNSMSKLLAILDHAVIEQFDSVKNAILNKAYLAQLIEIQQTRGAKNGHFTVQALGLHSHSQTVADIPKLSFKLLKHMQLKMSPLLTPFRNMTALRNNKETEDIIELVLKGSMLSRLNESLFRRLIHQLLHRFGNTLNTRKGYQSCTSKKSFIYLFRFVEGLNTDNFYKIIPETHYICTFFRALLTYSLPKLNEYNLMLYLAKEPKVEISKLQAHVLYQSSLYSIIQRKQNGKSNKSFNMLSKVGLGKDLFYKILNFSSLQEKCTNEDFLYNFLIKNTQHLNRDILCRDGVLVDWLSEVDPELIILSQNSQIKFMFSKVCNDFRFYLLSLICHQSNWETLIYTLNYLLIEHSEIDIDCSMVLNFMEALINNPKLWQGRDKSVPITDKPEIIFLLNETELNFFTQYILKEGELELNNTTAIYDYKLCSRIKLLFRVTNKNGMDLLKFNEYVFQNSCTQLLRQKVLQQMYLMTPSIKFLTSNLKGEYASMLLTLKGCQADKVSNYLITCLANLFLKKDYEALSCDTELLIRKLAASHPALFLRQLGVLSSSIQSRSQINLRTFREEYHSHRFIQILRTLELLQPLLFEEAYKDGLQNSLQCYFAFFKHHSYAKECFQILIKFLELLQEYINLNPSSALLFIEQFVDILIELAAKFNSVIPLHQLVQEIALLQHKTIPSSKFNEEQLKPDFDLEEELQTKSTESIVMSANTETIEVGTIYPISQLDCKGVISFVVPGSQNKSAIVSQHVLNLIKIVKYSNAEDEILGPLQEIECLTLKRFSFLNDLFDRLLQLIFSPSVQIRSNAFILLIRNLKHNPGLSDINRCTLNAYIQCLRDDNSSVATTAVYHLVEITLLLQEYASEILAVAFSLGIRSRLNTCSQIKQALQTILLQNGY